MLLPISVRPITKTFSGTSINCSSDCLKGDNIAHLIPINDDGCYTHAANTVVALSVVYARRLLFMANPVVLEFHIRCWDVGIKNCVRDARGHVKRLFIKIDAMVKQDAAFWKGQHVETTVALRQCKHTEHD